MSLYNAINGVNPAAGVVLQLLGIEHTDVERFRDAYVDIRDGDHEPWLAIYTRTGGNNREDYPQEKLKSHPWYVQDVDDDFDETYATFLFQPDEHARSVIRGLMFLGTDTEKPGEKMLGVLEKLRAGDTADPAVKRALDVGEKIFRQISEASKADVPRGQRPDSEGFKP